MICNRRIALSLPGTLRRQAVVWAVVMGVVAVAQADEPWQPVAAADREGVTLDRRALVGSKFYEYRAQVVTTATPEAVLNGIWGGVTAQLPPTVTQRKMLSIGAAELLFYDQIKTKVVSDRDYTIRMVLHREQESGIIQVPFGTMNDLGPPPAPGYVRVPTIRGNWIITPGDAGRGSAAPGAAPATAATKVTYLCYSDPGGSIPAFMARGAQQDQVMMDMHRILARALHPATTAATTAAR